VYAAADLSDSVSHFFRAAGGQLSFDGCLSNDGSAGSCVDLPPAGAGGPLDDAFAVAVSPDGSSVYVGSGFGASVSHFLRAAGGQLSFGGCLSNSGSAGACVDLPPAGAGGPLENVRSVAVSPGGGSVYVVSLTSDSVSHFFRAVAPAPPAPPTPPAPPAVPPPAGSPVFCQGKRATIVGTAGADRLRGTAGADVIAGLGGDDSVAARGGADLVCGGQGADTLVGGPGADRLFGGGGPDRVRGGLGGDALFGGPGPDDLSGGPGEDRCTGGRGADRARGCEITRSL
jgi:Ca2+-binding RTX toxin-like protein